MRAIRLPALATLAVAMSVAAAALPAVPAKAQAPATLHDFTGGADGGFSPTALLYYAGALYGVTPAGGAGCGGVSPPGCGVAFKLDPATGAYAVLHSFRGGADGAAPEGTLIQHGGILYGTTYAGGTGTCQAGKRIGCGTVFKLNPRTGKESVLYSFKGGTDGQYPTAGLIRAGGIFYGTTYGGGGGVCNTAGNIHCGTLFSFDPATGTEAVLHRFQGGSDGALPMAGLTSEGGAFYGTTYAGGRACVETSIGCGALFRFDPAGAGVTVLHGFGGQFDGYQPYAGLIAEGGVLYGTTYRGGALGGGVVFRADPATGAETVLHDFETRVPRASGPYAGLLSQEGRLYGTTLNGGAVNLGTIYELNPATGKFTVLHSFAGPDGGAPRAGLVHKDRIIYGITGTGGSGGGGTVFRLAR